MNRILIVFSTLFLSLAVFGQAETKTLTVQGLHEPVIVRRDGRSIPYIEARSDADLYFAQGYVTASDRLWQMDVMRRVARGQTAEIFGKATLEEDKRWRTLGFSKIAEESLQYILPESRAALENYARGVNAYIATLDDKTLPIEFRILQYRPTEWKPSDPLVIGKILSDALSSTWRQDLLRAALQDLPQEKFDDLTNQVTPYDVVLFGKDVSGKRNAVTKVPKLRHSSAVEDWLAAAKNDDIRKTSLERIGLYAEELAASNNWVISGSRTADGKPLLANDPHLRPTAPGIWYLTSLSAPGLRVSGVTVPGLPGIILGHNQSIAWGATNVGPDVQDIYLETFNGDGKYKTPGGWETPVTRKEEIRVRSNPLKPDTEAVTIDVVETRNGPVITEENGRKYSLKWTALDPKNSEIDTFMLLDKAANWNDFMNAGRRYGGAMQNFVYADTKGNIGWYAMGRIPLRRTGDGALPYDGSTNDGEWTGYIPFDDLPHLYNPKDGLIVTANQRTVSNTYKYTAYVRDAAMPWRARRIYDRLKDKTKVTMDDVRDVQYDVTNIPLLSLAQEIVKLNAASPETLGVLKNWDGRMTVDSEAALLTNEIRGCLANRIADENRPVPAALIRERILYWAVPEGSARWLPKGFANYTEFLRSCDASSRQSLADPKRFGPDESKWKWGAVTAANFPHPLAVAPLIGVQFATPKTPLDGSGQTPDVASYVSMRHIASPGNWDLTRHVIPLGESGDPRSPYYKDEFEAWRTGTPQIFPFSQEAVEKAAKSVTVMKP
jgi:penicillin amidase